MTSQYCAIDFFFTYSYIYIDDDIHFFFLIFVSTNERWNFSVDVLYRHTHAQNIAQQIFVDGMVRQSERDPLMMIGLTF